MKSSQGFFLGVQVMDFSKYIILFQYQRYDLVEMVVKFIVFDDLVGHGYSEGLHWMVDCVVVSSDHSIEVVDNILFEIHHLIIINIIQFNFSSIFIMVL